MSCVFWNCNIPILPTLSAGFEPAAFSLGGRHSIQAELREHRCIGDFEYKSFGSVWI
jgi:hypothetical protein